MFTKAYARINQVGVGDGVTIAGRRLEVVAVVEGTSIGGAGVLVDRADLDRFGGPAPTGVLVAAKDPANLLAAHDAVRAAAGEGTEVDVLADRRDDVRDVVDLLFALAAAMLGLTLLIAVVGVGTTAALSVVERTKESGVLRALGFSRFALGSTTVAESALHGVLGGVAGLVIGVPHAWLGVLALGVDTPPSVPVPLLALMTASLVALTALSGLLPARKAAKASPVAAMRVE
ncbi:ABC transporter permease [Umezawaea tangerina]|uniref:ABC transporter permease n=1 Tax=Umezawaea tangerina TaxID=84725 RepID=UPI0011B226AF|nr:ABC transporter permease [Umezawaea tangerina]